MNTRVFILLFIICLIIHTGGYAQNKYQLGTLPSINLNTKLADKYSFNFNWQSRQIYSAGEFNGESDNTTSYPLNDFTIITSRKIGLNNALAVGYLLRFEEGEVIQRSLQQFIIVRRYNKFRLAHRFRTDQTFAKSEDNEFRLRYRLSSEIPLNGQSLDPKEFYLKLNNEYLNSLQAGDYDLEIRLIPMLGRLISPRTKIELGVDYRVSSFLNTGSEHVFWAAINGYFKI